MNRVPELDGVRGVAILAVFFTHTGLLPGGFLGVDVFFALSGFLITTILLKEFDRTEAINLPAFYLRRARRLMPAVVVLVAFCLVWSYFAPIFSTSRPAVVASTLFYCANWQAIYSPESGLGPLSHCWSLSIEEQFYLSWPLALLALLKLKISRRALFAGLCLLAIGLFIYRIIFHLRGSYTTRVYMGTDTHADGLVLGCAAALMPDEIKERIQQLRGMVVPVVCYSLPLLFLITPMNGISGRAAIFAVPFLVALSLPSVAKGASPLSALLSHSSLVYFGQRSYSFYLWHFPVAQFIVPRFGLPTHFAWVPAIAFSVILAEASYRFIERPFLVQKPVFKTDLSPVPAMGTMQSSEH